MISLRNICVFGAIAVSLTACEGFDLSPAGSGSPDGPAAPMTQPMPGPFLLYFDFDSAKVTAEGHKVVASAAAAVAAAKPAAVIVTGHADRAGPDAYNFALSKRRAEAVALALIMAGVTTNIGIFVASYGENELQVPTDDGRREPKNRRAVIALKPSGAQPQLGAERR